MKLIKPKYEILESQGLYKDIEIAARTCYKSEDKITEDSAEKMVKSLIERKHTAMLEHGTVYLSYTGYDCDSLPEFFLENKYSKVISKDMKYYITSNYRVLIEGGVYDLYKNYICKPTEFHEKRVSVRFTCDRGVSHEFVRHRVFSFAQESTRYCNYSKDKFGSELTFIEPCYLDKLCDNGELDLNPTTGYSDMFTKIDYLDILNDLEYSYNAAIIAGLSPQEARMILPNSLKTELVMTGFINDWKGFFILRDAVTAHPQAYELAHPLHKEFKQLELL